MQPDALYTRHMWTARIGERQPENLVAPLRRIMEVSRLTHVVKERRVFLWPL